MSRICIALNVETLTSFERMGEKSATKVIEQIENSKQRGLQRLLFGLDIRHVGDGYAKRIARQFHTIENLKSATVEQLDDIPDIGLSVAESVFQWFRDEKNIELIERLRNLRRETRNRRIFNRNFGRKLCQQNICSDRQTRKLYPRRSRQNHRRPGRKSLKFGQQKHKFRDRRKRCGFKIDESRSRWA